MESTGFIGTLPDKQRHMKICRPVCLLLPMMFAFPVGAQQTPPQLSGELSSGGSPVFQELITGDVGMPADYSWFIEDDRLLECNIRFVLMRDIALGEIDLCSQQGNLSTEYHLNDNGMAEPYLNIEIGWRRTKFGSVRESGLFIGSKAVIKFFLNDSNSIDTSISYKISADDFFIIDFGVTDGYFNPRIGFKALF